MLECVVNVSEGRDPVVLAELAAACGNDLLDVHHDAHHHRSVFTLVGVEAPRELARAAVARLDLGAHQGVHPRFGVVDVVPFVALDGSTSSDAIAARDDMVQWLAAELGVPGFAYGPERTLPEVRRRAFVDLLPDAGPARPHPTAGACAVGARPPLVAYNVVLDRDDLPLAREVAASVRCTEVRALGLAIGHEVQVSMNLVAPLEVGPGAAVERVRALAPVRRTELVGLVPRAVLHAEPPATWAALDLDEDRTIEARIARRG